MTAFSGTCGMLTEVSGACNDDTQETLQSQIAFAVTGGEQYLLQVSEHSASGKGGLLELHVMFASARGVQDNTTTSPPVLTNLLIQPAFLAVGTGSQSINISVNVIDVENDVDPAKVKVVAKFADKPKEKVVLDNVGNGNFSGRVTVDTTLAQDVSLKIKAKDIAKNQATSLKAMVAVSDLSPITLSDVQISDTSSVFRVLGSRGNEGFDFPDGLFIGPGDMGGLGGGEGVTDGPVTLVFSQVNLGDAQVLTSRFQTIPDEGAMREGVADSGSCNYLYDEVADSPDQKILCPLCNIVVNANSILPGTVGQGVMTLILDLEDTDDTRTNPLFESESIPVQVHVNQQGRVERINSVFVTPE
jgi:hypothetical protein